MKIQCKKEKLSLALQKVEKITVKNPTLPVLKCILFEAKDKNIYLKATNLDIGAEVEVSGKVYNNGSFAVPSSVITHLITNINNDEDVVIEKESIKEIAKRSRFTPRSANYLLKRCRDYAQVHKNKTIDNNVINNVFSLLGVDEVGLTKADLLILETIIDNFKGGPVGLNTIAASLSEDQKTLEEYNEPYLIQIGFLERTPRGRMVTEKAYKHFNIKPPLKDSSLF